MNQPWMFIVLIGLIIIVYASIIPKRKPDRKDQPDMIHEVESAMDHFAVEMEEQNKAIIQLFTDTKKDYELHSAKLASRVETLEKHNQQLQNELSRVGFMTEQMQKKHIEAPVRTEQPEASPGLAAASRDTGGSGALKPEAEPAAPLEDERLQLDSHAAPAAMMNIKQRYSELFTLYEQGKSMDAIAKKLGMNKGEISLILQLAKREEHAYGQ